MTDDYHCRDARDEAEDDYGPPLFADTSDDDASDGLSFGTSDTGPLPHWTEPPTGEMPRTLATSAAADHTDDLDVWSSFAGKAPVWQDDQPIDPHDETGEMDRVVPLEPVVGEGDDITSRDDSIPLRREPGRITIGTDPTDDRSRPVPRKGRAGEPTRGGRPARSGSTARPPTRPVKPGARDLPTAIGVGLLIAAVFVITVVVSPKLVLLVVVAALAFGAIEYFDKVSEKDTDRPRSSESSPVWRPDRLRWAGEQALRSSSPWALSRRQSRSSVPRAWKPHRCRIRAITTLGVVWIGSRVVRSSDPALLEGRRVSRGRRVRQHQHRHRYLVPHRHRCRGQRWMRSSLGSAPASPLRAWISPEQEHRGTVRWHRGAIIALLIVSFRDVSTHLNSAGDLILLAIVISVAAPLGDSPEHVQAQPRHQRLRTIIRVTAGCLIASTASCSRCPVYYLLQVLQPWVTK